MTDVATVAKPTQAEIDKAAKTLVESRVRLLFSHPFFGQLALRLKLIAADPSWCPTAATDGVNFYFNPQFVNRLDHEENVFLVAHELGHCIYEHFMRREGRDPKMWNIAGDYIINNTLDEEIVEKGKSGARVIDTIQIYLDHKYDGYTTEEIYDDLMEQKANGGDPEGDGELLDVHIDMNSDGQKGGPDSGDAQGGGQGEDGEGGLAKGPAQFSEEERKQLSNDMRDALIQAAQAVGAGDVPGAMQRLINTLVEPKIDWREVIRSQIESSLKSNFTWMRPNRKSQMSGAILPGMDNDFKIDVVLSIDTSGSISQDMLRVFVSEVAGIMEEYEDYRIRIWQFDTQVYGYDEFTADDGRDIREYEITGGGGTSFMVNWEYMKENEIEPDQFIMFTDGQPYSSWGDADYCDTVFLIHTKYGKPEAPFGISIYYDEAA